MSTTSATASSKQREREGRRVFTAMNLAAWISLCIGVLLCGFGLEQFSDENMGLMLGIGFLVGSVFIYTIGTAMNLVHERNVEK